MLWAGFALVAVDEGYFLVGMHGKEIRISVLRVCIELCQGKLDSIKSLTFPMCGQLTCVNYGGG